MRCGGAILVVVVVVVVVRVWPVGLPALWPVNSLQHPADVLAELGPALLQQQSRHQCVCVRVCEVVFPRQPRTPSQTASQTDSLTHNLTERRPCIPNFTDRP